MRRSKGSQLIVFILLPMLTAAGMLLLGERAVSTKGLLGLLVALLNLAVAVALVLWVRQDGDSAAKIGRAHV